MGDDSKRTDKVVVASPVAVLESRAEIGAMLAAYHTQSRELMTPAPMMLSLATDKSTVRSFQLMNTAAVLPDNRACWLCPQVPSWGRRFVTLVHRRLLNISVSI